MPPRMVLAATQPRSGGGRAPPASAPSKPLESAWPRNFTRPAASGGVPPEALRALIRHDLLRPAPGVFTVRGDAAVLSSSCTAGAWLGALAECSSEGCSCSRHVFPLVRPLFRDTVVRCVLAAAGGARPNVRYVGVGSGLLLADAEILSGLVEAGAQVSSITLVDAGYGTYKERDSMALAQLGSLFSPAPVVAFDSLSRFGEACTSQPDRYGHATVLVACDPSTAVAQLIKQVASVALAQGGHAFLLLNGGRLGASTRAWVRGEPAPPAVPALHAAEELSLAAKLAASDAALGLREVDVGDAALDSEEGAHLRKLFDRDTLAVCRPVDEE